MVKCKYEGCNEKVFEDDCCILHVELPEDEESAEFERINKLKQEEIEKKLKKGDLNFGGVRLHELKFSKIDFSSDVNFSKAKIRNDIEIRNCIFRNDLFFTHAEIDGNVKLNSINVHRNLVFESAVINGRFNFKSQQKSLVEGCIFMAFISIAKRAVFSNLEVHKNIDFEYAKNIGSINFFSTVIKGELCFYGAKKIGEIGFDGDKGSIGDNLSLGYAEIQGDVTFESTKIYGKVDCNSVKIEGNANFKSLKVDKAMYFENAIIESGLNLESAILGAGDYNPVDKTASFQEAEINGSANFENTEFMSRTGFVSTHFKGNVFFNKTKFHDFTHFNGAKFFEDVDFDQTTFKEKVDFSKASFLEVGLFSEINISNDSNFIASFEDARLKNVAFRDCDLTCVAFKHVILENCELSTSNWTNKILEHKDYEENKSLMRAFKAIKNATFRGESKGYKDSLGRYCKFIKRFLKELWAPSQFKKAEIAGDTYRRLKQCLQNEGSYNKAGKFYINEMNMKKEVYRSKNKKSWLFYIFLSITSGYGEKLTPIFTIFTFYWIIYVSAVYFMPNNKLVIPVGSGILSILTALFVYVFARKMAR